MNAPEGATGRSAAYYLPVGEDEFEPTADTAGPWSEQAQHMGPPAALLARALSRCAPREDTVLSKLTIDILGPLPLAPMRVMATVLRPGRTIELVGAELSFGDVVAARATGWRLARADTAELVEGVLDAMPPPSAGQPLPMPPGWYSEGYLNSIEWRWLHGAWDKPGPAVVWGRPLLPLVAGEPTDGLCTLLIVTDSASGLSARLDPGAGWLFPNTDLTVHLHRTPSGPWAGLDANTVLGPTGAAVANATLSDENGPVGSSAQILTVRRR